MCTYCKREDFGGSITEKKSTWIRHPHKEVKGEGIRLGAIRCVLLQRPAMTQRHADTQ